MTTRGHTMHITTYEELRASLLAYLFNQETYNEGEEQ
jgi:hypothetical protein